MVYLYKFSLPKSVEIHKIRSDKLGVNVLNLRTVGDDSVSKEPKELYEWAKLFNSVGEIPHL